MADFGTVYREAQGRILRLVTNQVADLPVPACPGWTVKDVLAHLAGVIEDHRKGNLEGAPGPEWTQAQVDRRKDRTAGDIAAEWHMLSHTSPRILAGEHGGIFVADIVSHEFDIRGAIGNREGRTSQSVRTAALFFINVFDFVAKQENLPPLRIQVEDKAFTFGEGEPQATLTISWFDLLRTLSGRRSEAQLRAYQWDSDPDSWLPHLFIFGPAGADIDE